MGKTLLWIALAGVGLVLVGMVVSSLLGVLLKIGFYLLIGAAVVGGGMYVAGRVRGAIRGGDGRRQIRR
ncbi:MAG TPA: hypothetical protein VF163_14920 [Micromonosporaceae bacterium]